MFLYVWRGSKYAFSSLYLVKNLNHVVKPFNLVFPNIFSYFDVAVLVSLNGFKEIFQKSPIRKISSKYQQDHPLAIIHLVRTQSFPKN